MDVLGPRIVIAAFDGWNDAGEAASSAIEALRSSSEYDLVHSVDPELYFDYQYTRPSTRMDAEGRRQLTWPEAGLWRPRDPAPGPEFWLLTGAEPARTWQAFASEFIDIALRDDITGLVTLGAMLADVPHTRPISIFSSSQNEQVREAHGLERSLYEGPVGILTVFEHFAENAGIPTASLWASVPHYVASATPSPKVTLALLDRLEELTGLDVDRQTLRTEAATWEASIDAAASEDEDMAEYIRQLERTRDTWDSPEASGDAIAQAFERYLRRRDDGPGDRKR
ncbi:MULTISPECIES: PAC2 family protein [Microbacterium]|uniref:PAC2 family protein n=1 Tax=Microbacterium TaxID=33882 RepID=UPI000D9F36EE|nr:MULTISPECIES: PAC2 family protein [Microbacterium]QYG10965.1 PAC2 family protein [Microbacterium sp. PAMC22086]